MTDLDTPFSLREAAQTLLRGVVTASTLKAAAERGELTVERLGRKIVVTPKAIEEWRELCRAPAREPGFGSDQNAKTAAKNNPQSGSLETGAILKARNAALATVKALKEGSQNISPQNTPQNEKTAVTLPQYR